MEFWEKVVCIHKNLWRKDQSQTTSGAGKLPPNSSVSTASWKPMPKRKPEFFWLNFLSIIWDIRTMMIELIETRGNSHKIEFFGFLGKSILI